MESINNVLFLKTDPKARYQGYSFYFREGFCWIDVNSTYLKARIKSKGIFDVLSMSLFTLTKIPDWYYVCLINSELISLYVDNFINNTSHFQINDARQLPIIIPNNEQLSELKSIYDLFLSYKQNKVETSKSKEEFNQCKLDSWIENLYLI